MNRKIRLAGYVFLGLVLGLAVIVGALYVLTQTEYGLERVRRFALEQIGEQVEGELRVARIESAGLFGGVVLHDVTLEDPRGFPFLRADSIRLQYRWRNLLRGQIVFDRLVAYRPEVYVTRLPGDTLWNYERVFPDRTPGIDEPNDFILIDRVTIVDGLAVVRTPWKPDPVVEPEDTARILLEEIPGYGTVRVYRFEDVDAVLPRVLWESPVEEGKLIRVASLSTRGYIFETPFDLVDFGGVVTIRDSLIAFEAERFRLPNSRGSALGRVIADDGNFYDIRIVADAVDFADIQWLYPPLPDEGYGELVFRIQSQPGGTLWYAQDAYVRAPGTEVRGDFGIVTGDTLYFTRVNLRASPIDLELVADMLPGELDVEGLMVGTVVVEGPVSSLSTEVDVRLSRAGAADAAPAHVRGSGTLDLRAPFGVENLDLTVDGLDVALIPVLRDRLDAGGKVSGRIRATGRLDRSVRFATAIRHELAGRTASALHGSGTLQYASRDRAALDATLEADSIALELLGAVVPALGGVRGEVRGPVRLVGPLSDLTLDADLESRAGRLELDGRFDLTGPRLRYTAEGRITEFRLDRVLAGLDETVLTARVEARATGDDDAARVRVELDSGWTGPVELSSGIAQLRFADGLVHVDSLTIEGAVGRLVAAGTLGTDSTSHGTLEVAVQIDSLAALRRRLFDDAALALADTMGSRIGGAAFVRATLRGSIADLAADGELRLDGATYRAFEVGRADVRFAARGIGTDSLHVAARGDASGASVYGRPLDSAHATVAFENGAGRFELEARGAEPVVADYRLLGGFQRLGDAFELELRELHARDWVGDWRLAEPARVRLGGRGLDIDDLFLIRGDGTARIRAYGQIPWRSRSALAATESPPADFRLEIEGIPLAPLRADTAGSTALARLSGAVTVSGTAESPVMTADLLLDAVHYDDVRVDRIDAHLEYADQRLEGRVEAYLDGEPILTGSGLVPVDLALAPIGERRLDRSVNVRFRADRVPAAFLTGMVDGFREVRGDLTGSITVGGTTVAPRLGGLVELSDGEMVWNVSGVRYRDVEGTFRVLEDQVVAVDLVARTDNGTATAAGTLTFVPLTDPELALTITTREFQLARRPDVAATGTGRIRLSGRYTQPRLTGNIQIDRGELFLDEVWHRYNVVALDDETLLSVVDTSIVSIQRIENPFTRNLIVQDFTIDVGRDSWLRGRTLDVEVAGRLHVDYDRRGDDLRLTGALNAIRGAYELYLAEEIPAHRFAVREGTVEFDGTPGINPRLDIVAMHRVRTEGGTLNVEAVVTGTLRDPRVRLRSDVQPPIAESDLLSLVLFGRPFSELVRVAGPGDSGTEAFEGVLAVYGFGFATGAVSTGLQSLFADYDLLDYIAITEWEGDRADGSGLGNIFARSQVEVGRYIGEDWYVAFSSGLPTGNEQRTRDLLGARVEWRFAPTWTGEFFWENRFSRGLSLDAAQRQKVYGFFLFREWGF
ncbi:MAG TPA: translocation/assembly module TamB domain-containing protein [Longimicrobiales bacterium]